MNLLALSLDPMPMTLMLLGLALLGTIIFINVRRRRDSGAAPIAPRERLERDKQMGGMRNDLRTMMVELEELTRRFSAQLDNKSAKLERLIQEADKRIEQLNGRVHQPPREAADPASTPANNGSDSPDAGPADPLTCDVYRLADEGNDSGEIARQLDEHVGKVELILALRQK